MLSPYEVARLKRIERNERYLASLGLKVARNSVASTRDDARVAPLTPAQMMRRELVTRKRANPNFDKPRLKRAKPEPARAGPRRISGRKRGVPPVYTGWSIETMADGRSVQRAPRVKYVKGAVGSILRFPANSSAGWPAELVRILERRVAYAGLVWDGVAHHVAKNNETPRQIARSHGVSVTSVIKLNSNAYAGLKASSRLRAKTAITVRRTNADGDAVDGDAAEFEYRCLYLDGPRAGEEEWESQEDIDSARTAVQLATAAGKPVPKKARRCTSAPAPAATGRHRRSETATTKKLDAKERFALGAFDMAGFTDWLRRGDDFVKPSSEANARQVTARVADLVSGRGVAYKRWAKPFNANRGVTMQTNFHALMKRAVAWEFEQGRDNGNGWAIRHPIKKMMLYQAYLARVKRSGRTATI